MAGTRARLTCLALLVASLLVGGCRAAAPVMSPSDQTDPWPAERGSDSGGGGGGGGGSM